MSVISPLRIDNFIEDKKAKEIKSVNILSSKGKYDIDGLFSESIFGLDRSKERKEKYGYINLNIDIIHPFIYQVFKKIEQKLMDLIDGETMFYDPHQKVISKKPGENFIEISGFDGAMYAIDNGINYRGGTNERDKIIKRLLEVIKNGKAFIDKCLVCPPDFRPAQISEDGTLIGVDDLNAIYIKIINLSKKIKSTKHNDKIGKMSDSSLLRKELQLEINNLYEYGKMRIGKKSGVNRSSLLGKRVDFSGRAIITAGYDIPIGKVGVPYRMLANISEPFLIHYFSKELVEGSSDYKTFLEILKKNDFHLSLNVMVITNFLRDLAEGFIKLDKKEEEFIIKTFQTVLGDKPVLLKRDPALHKGSWQSFLPIVTDGVAIQLNITCTTLFNADFDGDQMAIYQPLTLESHEEAMKLMNIPTGTGNVSQSSIDIKHELILASYIMTNDSKKKAPDLGLMTLENIRKNRMGIGITNHVAQTLTVLLPNKKRIKTILGRAIFTSVFPDSFLNKYYSGFIDELADSKFVNKDVLQNLLKEYESKDAALIIDDLVKVLRLYTTIYPSSLVLSELLQSDVFNKFKEKLKKAKTLSEKQKIIEESEKFIRTDLKKVMPMINEIIASGSRGKPNQLRQMLVSKGILQDAQGNLLFIDESYIDGLSPTSTFMGGFGGRKGIMDRSRQTATTGYLFRKLIYAMASVMYNEDVTDCKTKKTVSVKVTKKNSILLSNRYMVKDGRLILLTPSVLKKLEGERIQLRSPIFCKTHRVCKTCYGDLMGFYHSIYIGIIAAQAMGERGSQEMMKTFHTGGSTNVEIPNILNQMLDNNPFIKIDDLKKYFTQDGAKLMLKSGYNIKIILNQKNYFNINITSFTVENPDKSDILIDSMSLEGTTMKKAINLKPFSSNIEFYKDDKFLETLEIAVDDGVFIPVDFYETKEYRHPETKDKIIELRGNSNNLPFVLGVELASDDMSVTMKTVLGIIEKKNIMKYPEVAFNKLSKIYGDSFGIAYNHIELLISQIFRNVSKPELPARLIEPYDAKVYSIKNIAHLESFLSGMLFENMSKSMLNGFVNDSTIQNPLEKLLGEDLDF